jgi:hypothetical protein
MALVALTGEQKEVLKDDLRFRRNVEAAVLAQARYWVQIDGTAVPGGQNTASLVRWAKSRFFAAQIVQNPSSVSNQLDVWCDLFSLFHTTSDWDNSVSFNTDTVVTYMAAQNRFAALSDNVFDEKIKSIIF